MDDTPLPPFLANARGQMDHPKARLLAKVLQRYDLVTTAAMVAGMSTVPRNQANSYRLELLAQLAVACCAGPVQPPWQHLDTWLNRQLGVHEVAAMEDPAEDTFVINVLTPEGDFRVFGGLWEAGDSATTLLIETIASFGGADQLVS